MSVSRTGVFGGTFNPVHPGHLLVADDISGQLRLDRVLFVPAPEPPHKRQRLAPFRDRLAMLRLALRGWPGLEVCDVEARRPGPSYTVDTLRALRAGRGIGSVYLIVGSDQYQVVAGWHKPCELARLARLVVVSRPGFNCPGLFPGHKPGRVRFLPVVSVEISSALIRSRLARGMSIEYMLPSAVREYISEHQLYNQPKEA